MRAWVKWGGAIIILSVYQNMIQQCANKDDTRKISPKAALNIVKGAYKGIKDIDFFAVYHRTLGELPANVNF
jgi:hypothetical protein